MSVLLLFLYSMWFTATAVASQKTIACIFSLLFPDWTLFKYFSLLVLPSLSCFQRFLQSRGTWYVAEDWAAPTPRFPVQRNCNPFTVELVRLQPLVQSGDLSPSSKAIAGYLEHLPPQFTSEKWSFHGWFFISLFQLWPLTHFPALFTLSAHSYSGSCCFAFNISCFRHNMI